MRMCTCDCLDSCDRGTEGFQPLHDGLLAGDPGGGLHPLLRIASSLAEAGPCECRSADTQRHHQAVQTKQAGQGSRPIR